VELWCGDSLLLLALLLLLLLYCCGADERGKAGATRVSGAAGVLIRGARVWRAAAAGVLGVRAGTRGGIAAVRRGSVADTGGAAVSVLCCGAGTCGARHRPVTRASGGRGGREKRKKGAKWLDHN
jgi:hypothetical protein